MSHVRREKPSTFAKETRWDRIRKRHHTNAIVQTLKTEAVKRFIEMDFIGKHQNRILNGIADDRSLDPILVMNIRHEMVGKFKRAPHKPTLASAVSQKKRDACVAHNINVEDRYLENQLQRFREHLKKEHQRRRIPRRQLESLLIDNRGIMKSFNLNEKCLRELYKTPIEVLNEVNDLFTKCNKEKVKYKGTDTTIKCHALVVSKEENCPPSMFILEEKEKRDEGCNKKIFTTVSNEIHSMPTEEEIQQSPLDSQTEQSCSKDMSQLLSDVKEDDQGLELGNQRSQECTKEDFQQPLKVIELDHFLPLKDMEVPDETPHPETEEINELITTGNIEESTEKDNNNIKEDSPLEEEVGGGSNNLKGIFESNAITNDENKTLSKTEEVDEETALKSNMQMPLENDVGSDEKGSGLKIAEAISQLSGSTATIDKVVPTGEKDDTAKITDKFVEINDLTPSNRGRENDFPFDRTENSPPAVISEEISTIVRSELAVSSTSNAVNLRNLCNDEEKVQALQYPRNIEDHSNDNLEEVIYAKQQLEHRCVRFDEALAVSNSARQNSGFAHSDDAIESVISLHLAADAAKEWEEEGREKCKKIKPKPPEMRDLKNGLTLKGCSLEAQSLLMVTGGKMPSSCESRKLNEMLYYPPESVSTNEDHSDPPSSVNEEQRKIIEKLFETRSIQANLLIMRKYFTRWTHFKTIEKIERENVGDCRLDRVGKINIFLDKVRFEKDRLNKSQKTTTAEEHSEENVFNSKKDIASNIIKAKKYQNKIKVQQDIIDLQRVKLERQERIIMELKLGKLSEETKEARQELKEDLKTAIRSGDPKLKAKAKTLQLIGNLRDRKDDRFERLEGKALEPAFLRNMQERALARSIRQEQARQRRLKIEAEKEAQKLALEEAKRLEDEETKRLRVETWNERRRQERMAKILKERERQRAADNMKKAQEFCRRLLLSRIGMEGFKRLLERRREKFRKYQELRLKLSKKRYLQAWFTVYCIAKARRDKKADDFYERILKRRIINWWCCYVEMERSKVNVAVDWYDFKLVEGVFRKWWAHAKRMRIIEESKMKQASSHHDWQLKWKVLDCWRRLKQMLQLERETEERRQKWRMKIWELIPDYTPARDDLEFI
uniref:Sfi1 spindle body domain-containing protein n=2 Tax=Glossina morsitans morsitans TaxID=37546 RepID=A0A1B0FR82_GLOMM